MTQTLRPLRLDRHDAPGFPVFVQRDHPRPSSGLHVLFATERARPSDQHLTPDVDPESRGVGGYRIVDLPALVTMKLIAYRLHDRVHIIDLASVGLIGDSFAERLPKDLRPRLKEVLEEGRRQGSIV